MDSQNADIPTHALDTENSTRLSSRLTRVSATSTFEVEDPSLKERRRRLAEQYQKRPHPTAMLSRIGRLLRFLARVVFAHVLLEQRCIDNIRKAAERGTVVYVMQSRSFLDYLYFNWVFLSNELPMADFSNGHRVDYFRGFFRWFRNVARRWGKSKQEDIFQALISKGRTAFIFLERPRSRAEDNVEYSQKFLFRLIRAQRNTEIPFFVMPMLLVWEKRPDPKQASLIDDIFGSGQSPGGVRQVIHWFQTIWQNFLNLGQPIVQVSEGIDVREFMQEYPDTGSADASELLLAKIEEYLDCERKVILGPVGEPAQAIWRDLSQRPELTAAIESYATEEGMTEEEATKVAKDQFDEIAAQPSLLFLKVFSAFLSLVWYRIYDGLEIDQPGLDRVREAGKKSSLILVPSHKSHVDYLVISYLFYNAGLTSPLIAAGVNLKFFPMGYIFRKSGAFFLRRSFRGDSLYPVVFREYLIRMMEEGYPIEYFIEGTRSRTGKLIKPKYGMLDMILRAYVSGRLESVQVVPISVGYERIIEEGAFHSELLGGEKEKEGLGGLLRTPQFLQRKYGRVYVDFDEPISVGDYLEKYGIDTLSPDPEGLDAAVVRLAHRIIYDINCVTTVTPSSLLSLVLLNNPTRGIARERLLTDVGFVLRFLIDRFENIRISRTLRDAIDASGQAAVVDALADGQLPDLEASVGLAVAPVIDEAILLLQDNEDVLQEKLSDEIIYRIRDEGRVNLAYYRNTIVHHFVPEALLAAAIGRFRELSVPIDAVREETLFLSRLFKYEWIYEERAEFTNVFDRTLQYFQESEWVICDEQTQMMNFSEESPELDFFGRLVVTFLEAYAIAAAMLPNLVDQRCEKKELLESILKQGRDQVFYYESLSKPTFQNALRLFVDWGILDREFGDGRKGGEFFRVSEEWQQEGRCVALEERLNAFVYGAKTNREPTRKLTLKTSPVVDA
jgi:glycerol-3-phosphate O-acyltransferase